MKRINKRKNFNPKLEYKALLSQFPIESQGAGLEPTFKKSGITHQPMTYGLILSSEALHYSREPNDVSKQRIKRAVHWLLDNSDLNNDGLPGWGLPQSWDAFRDGTTNPKNHPYTITTAFVLQGLLDALKIPELWKSGQIRKIQEVIKETSLLWCNKAWSEANGFGFFWYSLSPNDKYFIPNVSAMFLGSLARLISEQKKILTTSEHTFLNDKLDKAAQGIVSGVKLRADVPFWDYNINRSKGISNRPNDILHHTYILWGMEIYRLVGGKVHLPWSTKQAFKSINKFWKGGKLYEFPQDMNNRDIPARSWGAGMALAFYAKYGNRDSTEKLLDVIKKDYELPKVKIYPESYTKDDRFYPRYAVHVLYGLSYSSFKQ